MERGPIAAAALGLARAGCIQRGKGGRMAGAAAMPACPRVPGQSRRLVSEGMEGSGLGFWSPTPYIPPSPRLLCRIGSLLTRHAPHGSAVGRGRTSPQAGIPACYHCSTSHELCAILYPRAVRHPIPKSCAPSYHPRAVRHPIPMSCAPSYHPRAVRHPIQCP